MNTNHRWPCFQGGLGMWGETCLGQILAPPPTGKKPQTSGVTSVSLIYYLVNKIIAHTFWCCPRFNDTVQDTFLVQCLVCLCVATRVDRMLL